MFRKLVVLIVFVCLFVSTAFAQEMAAPEVLISGVFARPTAAEATEMNMEGMDMGTSGVFMTIENLNDFAVTLLSATTDAAGMVELHQSTVVNDVMQMGPVEGGIEIAAGAVLNFEEAGYHLMLMDLTDELVEGEAISVTLTFAQAEGDNFDVVIGAPVQQEASEASTIAVIGAWARPTVAEAQEAGMGGGMQMGEATPEATPEAMGGGMAMGEATEEAMGGGMHMGDMGGVSATYLQLWNRGTESDRLLSASTDVAGLVQIHEIVMNNDVAQMQEVQGGLEIPAGERLILQPGGYHIMMMELTQELVPGTAFLLTLTFESGVELTIAVPVYAQMQAMTMGS